MVRRVDDDEGAGPKEKVGGVSVRRACVEILVVGLRCEVGRGLDVVGGAEVSRVLSSRGGGPTRSERLCDFPRRGASLPTTGLRTSHAGAPPRTLLAVAHCPK